MEAQSVLEHALQSLPGHCLAGLSPRAGVWPLGALLAIPSIPRLQTGPALQEAAPLQLSWAGRQWLWGRNLSQLGPCLREPGQVGAAFTARPWGEHKAGKASGKCGQ